jgi:hypothetical protein
VRFKIAALCPIVALAMTAPLPAQNRHAPKLIPFDAPGASTVSSPLCAPECGTIALANNADGAVVGYYTDANIVNHGFVRAPTDTWIPSTPPERVWEIISTKAPSHTASTTGG